MNLNPVLKNVVEFSDIPGQVTHFRVRVPDCSTPVGYALVTHEGTECILWNIYVESKYRRHGLAAELIKTLQSVFDYIVTSYTSQHGKRLCERAGFVFDPRTNFLEWSKDVKKEKDVEQAPG